MSLLNRLVRLHNALGVAFVRAGRRRRNQVLLLVSLSTGRACHRGGGALNRGGLQVQGRLRRAHKHAQGAGAYRQILRGFLETNLLLQRLVLLHEALLLRTQIHHVVLAGHNQHVEQQNKNQGQRDRRKNSEHGGRAELTGSAAHSGQRVTLLGLLFSGLFGAGCCTDARGNTACVR